MKKSWILIITIMVSVIFVLITGCAILAVKGYKYSTIMYKNWGIRIPDGYHEVYATEGENSPLGDGERYHIFEYQDVAELEMCVSWYDQKDAAIEENVMKLMNVLKVDREKVVDFNLEYKHYSMGKSDYSKLYMIYIPSQKIVYIIEDFF